MGVPFDISEDVAASLDAMLHLEGIKMVVTPNPEILMKTLTVADYKNTLSSADISLPDGIGLLWATTFLRETREVSQMEIIWRFFTTFSMLVTNQGALRGVIHHLHQGSDTFFALHTLWNTMQSASPKVFYFGGEDDVPEEIQGAIRKRFPKVHVAGSCGGYPFRSQEDNEEILHVIETAKPDVLFVSLPFPKQEQWIMQSKNRLEAAGVRLVMVVGGTFDFTVGKRKRAPKWMTRSGIEWLWRLIQEPQRVGRIWTAVVRFPITILRRRLAGKKDLEIYQTSLSTV